MKLSKITFVILGVVVFVVAFALLYMSYKRQVSNQDQLKAQLQSNQAQLAKLSTDRQNWQSQLTNVEAELAQKQQALTAAQVVADNVSQGWPKDAQSLEYDEELFKLADGWALPINVVSAGEAAPLAIQGIPFKTTSFTVTVTGQPVTAAFTTRDDYENYIYGQVGNILGFIDALAKDQMFNTAKINVVNMTVPQLLSADDLANAGTKIDLPTATLTVTVYTHS